MKKFNTIDQLFSALKNVMARQRLALFAAGLVTTATVLVAVTIILSLIASVVILPVWSKITILALAGIASLFVFGRYAVGSLVGGNVEDVAQRLESEFPRLKGRLIAAIQFAHQKSSYGVSGDLIALNAKQALHEAGLLEFSKIVSFNRLWKTSRHFLGATVLAVALLMLLPGMFSHSYEVFSNPTEVIAPPLGYKLTAFPGSTEWVKYRDINIGAALVGDKLPKTATIFHRLAGGSWQETEVELNKQKWFALEMGDSVNASILLRQINKSFDYYVKAGRVETPLQKVDVVDRPRVSSIKLSIFYPGYTGLEPTIIDENNGSFSAIFGSRATIEIGTNLPIESASMIISDSSRIALKASGKSAETSVLVDKSLSYYIRLLDHLGEENPDPIEYYITSIPDEYPSIDVLRPGYDANLSEEMILPLKVRIFDDFGFSSLVLKYSVVSRQTKSEENVAVLHFSDRIKTEGEIEFNWDMDLLNLFPGDYVLYHLEVADNDMISGPKISQTRQYIARLPSLDEIIAEAEGESVQRISRAEQLLKSGHDLSERLKNISRKLKAQDKSSSKAQWQQQKELESIVDKNAEILKDIEEMAKQMDESVQKMSENSLMSREILEKLAQIQKLYQEVATPEMKEAQKRLMEALKNANQDELRKAIEDFKMTQEELLKRLERTLALLKKMQIEQKMEAMIRKAEQLAKRQEESNKNTEKSSSKQLPSLSQEEKDIQAALEELKKEVAELEKLMNEGDEKPPEQAKAFSEAVKKNDAGQNMQQMADNLSKKEKSEASKQGQKALSKLLEMLDKMQQNLLAMKGGDQDAIKKAMRAAIDDSNHLSKDQEKLLERAGSIDPRSIVLRDQAKAQQDLMKACNGLKNRITQLGKESPFIAAELQKLVDDATNNMELATTGFDSKKGFEAVRYQREAMTKLNKVSVRLMESMEQQKECNKGGSCSKPTSKLNSMCDKQNQLNKETQSQCNKPGGSNPTPGSSGREELGRLAGAQKAIRKSMEQLNKEFGGSRQLMGRLDDIAKEMKKVEEALAEGDVSQEMQERQLKIFSRMLEASRSLYRKDFSEQRKAATASDNVFYIPPQLSEDILGDRSKIEDRLKKYLGEDYPPQYEKQIKSYFKALLEIQSATNR